MDGDDYTLHLVYDDKWRIVAEYAGTESSPTIQHTHHAAGLGGRGASLPMDNVICSDIDKNGGFGSPDGTLETREYSCHNYRGDVCARITDDGKMLEWVQYSPYGVPFAQPAGDTDGDGDADQADLGNILSWISSGYDVTGDLDLDGDIDSTDSSLFSTAALGRGVLSGDDEYQHFGYTGHRHDEAVVTLVHARHRVLHTELGRWLRRDPLGYVDGMSLYEYVGGRAIVAIDFLGKSGGDPDDWLPRMFPPTGPNPNQDDDPWPYDEDDNWWEKMFPPTGAPDIGDPIQPSKIIPGGPDDGPPSAPPDHGPSSPPQDCAVVKCRDVNWLPFGECHCAVFCKGHIYSLIPRNGVSDPGKDHPEDTSVPGNEWTSYGIECRPGICECLEKATQAGDQAEPFDYQPLRCNSNWWVKHLLDCCFPDPYSIRPPCAAGWNDLCPLEISCEPAT